MRLQHPVHKAFLHQAIEDYQAAALLLTYLLTPKHSVHQEHSRFSIAVPFRGTPFFMLLQMSVEKLAKAAYCKVRGLDGKLPPKDHDIILFLKAVLVRNPNFLGFEGRHSDTFDFLLKELNPKQPAIAAPHEENLEYPWLDRHGRVKCPAEHLSLTAKYLNNALNRNIVVYMKEIKELLESFGQLFPS